MKDVYLYCASEGEYLFFLVLSFTAFLALLLWSF